MLSYMPFRKNFEEMNININPTLSDAAKTIKNSCSSESKPAKLPGKGEFPIGISFAYGGFKQKSEGEPVMVAFPKEGSGYDVGANA
jgi:ABC-type Fe3+ transport system substrate-binding protein